MLASAHAMSSGPTFLTHPMPRWHGPPRLPLELEITSQSRPGLTREAERARSGCRALSQSRRCQPAVFENGSVLPLLAIGWAMTTDDKRVRTGDILPEFAAGPEGNLYGVWQDGRFSPTGAAKVALSMSRAHGS